MSFVGVNQLSMAPAAPAAAEPIEAAATYQGERFPMSAAAVGLWLLMGLVDGGEVAGVPMPGTGLAVWDIHQPLKPTLRDQAIAWVAEAYFYVPGRAARELLRLPVETPCEPSSRPVLSLCR